MNRSELVNQTATAIDQSQATVDRVLSGLLNTIRVALMADDTVKIAEFGTFKIAHRPKRTGVNPRNQQPIVIAEHDVIVFAPSEKLKVLINDK